MAFDDGVKTVSGSVAHTDDAATKVSFVSVKCGIEPTLSGVSSVTETQTGRNLLDVPAREELTRNGVISSVASDGIITASGQSTGNGDIPITLGTSVNLIGGQNYTFSINGTDTRTGSVYVYFAGGSYISINNSNHSGTYTPSADQTITGVTLRMFNGQSITLSAKIMLEIGSTAHAYEPYTAPTTYTASLGRTIYGGTADIVNGTGKETYGEPWTWTAGMSGVSVNNNGVCYISKSDVVTINASNQSTLVGCICADSNFQSRTWAGLQNATANGCACVYGNGIAIKIPGYTTKQEYETYLTNNPLTFVYMLKTPTDFTFTPITPTPETVGKVNNVYCNTGDTEVTYHDNAHGFAEVTVNKTGKNLIDGTKFTRGLPSTTIGASIDTITTSNRYAYYGIRAGGGSLTVSSTSSDTDYFTLVLIWGYKDGVLTYYSNTQAGTSKTVDFSNCDYVRIGIGAIAGKTVPIDLTGYGTIQLELGSQASSYEPYEAVSKTAYLHKVIYGGTADVIRGTCEPKNILDSADASHTFTSGTNTRYTIGTIALKGGVTYTFSASQKDALTSNTRNTLVINDNGDYTYEYATGSNYHNQSGVHSMQYTPNADKTVTLLIWVHTPSNDVTYSEFQVEKGSSASDFAPYFEPFTFPSISIGTDEGENTLFANEGDSAITYRKETE